MIGALTRAGGGPAAKARAVIALLDEERKLIRSGAFEALAALRPRRDADVAALMNAKGESDPEFADLVRAIAIRAERNGRLMRALLDGARRGRERLSAIEAQTTSVGAYDSKGARIGGAAPRRDQRL